MSPERVTPFQQALERFHTAYGEFLAVCHLIPEELREESGVCGVWSPREVVAHLAGWQHEGARRFRELLRDPQSRKQYNVDAFNAQSVAERAGWSWEHTLADLSASYLKMQNAIADLMIANPSDWSEFAVWLEALGSDLVEHGRQLMAWV